MFFCKTLMCFSIVAITLWFFTSHGIDVDSIIRKTKTFFDFEHEAKSSKNVRIQAKRQSLIKEGIHTHLS